MRKVREEILVCLYIGMHTAQIARQLGADSSGILYHVKALIRKGYAYHKGFVGRGNHGITDKGVDYLISQGSE